MVKDLQALVYNKEAQVRKLQEQLNLQQNGLYGSSSEKLTPPPVEQLEWDFFNEAELLAELLKLEEEKQLHTTVTTHRRRKGKKKKPQPKHLQRVQVVHDLSDAEKQCTCGRTLKYIDSDVSEQLAIIPQTHYVIEHIRRRYGCRCKQCIRTASMPTSVLPGTQASATIIAHAMVSKYLDGVPLYRQEKIAARDRLDLPRSKQARWIIKSSENHLTPLYNLMQEVFYGYDIAHSDETGIQVLNESGRAPQSKSWLWIRYGGAPDKTVVLVDYSASRSGQVAKSLLDDFKGYLVCDAYSGYKPVIKDNGLKAVCCNDHARRRFTEIIKSVGKDHDPANLIASRAVAWYKPLYDLERKIKTLSAEEKQAQREQHAIPHWQKFIAWAQQLIDEGVQHKPTRSALQYLLNQAEDLQRYCEDGRLPMTNIRAEHVAKAIALARKNFLFAATTAGATASARVYSVLQTAIAHGHQPFEYMTVALNELANAKNVEDVEKMLPWNISAERVREIFNTYPAP